jgi:hypothetical protein
MVAYGKSKDSPQGLSLKALPLLLCGKALPFRKTFQLLLSGKAQKL